MTYSLAVSGWSAISALGLGAAAFTEGLRVGRSAVRATAEFSGEEVGDGLGELPLTEIGLVPDFRVREVLGRKNTRSMDRATGLAVATVGLLLDEQSEPVQLFDGRDVGLVLGTTTGSVRSMMEFTRDSLTQSKPFLVDPARFPNTVMNCAAGQCAIWHGLRGPNTTIAGAGVTGLAALRYATRLHRCGHADAVLCGAVEEFSVQRAWLEYHSRRTVPDDPGLPLGEGCAVFLLEDARETRRVNRTVLAEVLSLEFRVSANNPAAMLAGCATAALRAAGMDAADVWALAGDLGPDAEAAVTALVPEGTQRITVAPLLGDTGAAASSLVLAALLARAKGDSASAGRPALVVSTDRDGSLGCAVLRLGDGGER